MCNSSVNASVVLITSDLFLWSHLKLLGINSDSIGLLNNLGGSLLQLSSGGSLNLGFSISPLSMNLLDPWQTYSENRRSQRRVILMDSSGSTSYPLVSSLAPFAVALNDIIGYSSGITRRTDSIWSLSFGGSSDFSYIGDDSSLLTKWIVAVVSLPTILFLVSIVLSTEMNIGRYFKQSFVTFHHVGTRIFQLHSPQDLTDLLYARKNAALFCIQLFEAAFGISSILFIVSVAVVADSNTFTSKSSIVYIIGICSIPNCILSLFTILNADINLVIVKNCFSLFLVVCTGYVIELTSNHSELRFILTSCILMAIMKAGSAASSAMLTARQTKEGDSAMFKLSIVSICGWILSAIALGRFDVDYNHLLLDVAKLAFASIGIVSPILTMLGTIEASKWIVVMSGFFSILSVAASGGTLIGSSESITICNTNPSINGCVYHFKLLFAGSLIYLVSISIIFIIRKTHTMVEMDDDTKIELFEQIQEEKEDDADIIAIPASVIPRSHSKYTYLTRNHTNWLIWRVVLVLCILSWGFTLGGLGSVSAASASKGFVASGIMWAIFLPGSLALLASGAVTDSKRTVTMGTAASILSIACTGRMFATSSNLETTSDYIMTIGCILTLSTMAINLWLLLNQDIIYKLKSIKLLFNYDTTTTVLWSSIALLLLGWLIQLIGVSQLGSETEYISTEFVVNYWPAFTTAFVSIYAIIKLSYALVYPNVTISTRIQDVLVSVFCAGSFISIVASGGLLFTFGGVLSSSAAGLLFSGSLFVLISQIEFWTIIILVNV